MVINSALTLQNQHTDRIRIGDIWRKCDSAKDAVVLEIDANQLRPSETGGNIGAIHHRCASGI